jgi:hypothetical protein
VTDETCETHPKNALHALGRLKKGKCFPNSRLDPLLIHALIKECWGCCEFPIHHVKQSDASTDKFVSGLHLMPANVSDLAHGPATPKTTCPVSHSAITFTGTLMPCASLKIILGGFVKSLEKALLFSFFFLRRLGMPPQEASLSLGITFHMLKSLLKGVGSMLLFFRHALVVLLLCLCKEAIAKKRAQKALFLTVLIGRMGVVCCGIVCCAQSP